MTCKRCSSLAVNHHLHGRDGSDPELCDVCYWRKRAEDANVNIEVLTMMLSEVHSRNEAELA